MLQTVPSPPVATVSALTPADSPSALDTLVKAFHKDPGAVHMFPDSAQRCAGIREVFAFGLNYARRFGCVDLLNQGRAVAMWIPPEYSPPSWRRSFKSGLVATAFRLGRSAMRVIRFSRFMESRRVRVMRAPHWYLFCIGVHPDQQGRGLGAALLQHGLARARTTGAPCYLETVNAGNVPFYRAHGFHELGRHEFSHCGPVIWSLATANLAA
ncbi:MAG: GNAT family N-acetyltransferase [Verrucomicrobiae bacterium]|nr:GNAT family N-acetyltransferase [Verrucomicrobiae bacterium]